MDDLAKMAGFQAMARCGVSAKISDETDIQRDITTIHYRISDAAARANKLALTLRGMADRHYGPVPECDEGKSGNTASGEIAEVFQALDTLDRNLRFLSDQAERLARL